MKRRLVRAEASTPPDKRREALTLAALAFSGAAQAITLGEAEVRSSLGQPLEARIPVAAATGENLRGACFSLGPRGTGGTPALTDAELTLRRSAKGNFLEVRSRKPVQDPSVTVSVAVACPGTSQLLSRDFTLLVDAPVSARLPTGAGTVALGARQGDTLQSIARAIVPDDAAARADYLQALRQANPQLAARGEDAAIGPQEKIALPDLRTYARSPRRARSAVAQAPAPVPPVSRAQAPAPLAQAAEKSRPRTADASTAAATPGRAVHKPRAATAPAAAASRSRAEGSPFQLKLSAPEIDLSASRNIGERERAQLRERLAMLDADDQVAAMLSLRHSLKQLEARVAELQLKLSTMPPSLEQRPAAAQAKPAPAPVAPPATPPIPTPAPAPSPATPPPVAAVPVPPPSATPAAPVPVAPPPPAKPETIAKAETPPKPETPAKPETPPKPETPAKPEAAAKPDAAAKPSQPAATPSVPPSRVEPVIAPPPRASKPRLSVAESQSGDGHAWWWALAATVAILGLLWSFLLWRRKRLAGDAWLDEPETTPPPIDEIAPASVPVVADRIESAAAISDADLPTRLATNDAAELRRRYMEERFPELGTGMIDLEQPASVIKAARLLYEDGAAPRAVELLQFALEAHPAEVRHWLALFEIYRLERLTGEFGALALRFQQRFGDTEHWEKVRYFGREIDPANPLFKEPLDSLQTIGPRESRRLAAAASFDPLAENWLNAPMDFENEVLANELRNALMQKAGMKEEDLHPNPTSALRHVEMFTVA